MTCRNFSNWFYQ